MKKTSENIFAVSVSIATALFLAVGKTLVFFASGSIAILASALDSALDAVVSMVNFFAIRAAEKPADREHGFGHGKFEAFAEFGQGIFLLGSSVFLAFSAIERLFTPVPISREMIGIATMLVSLVITFFLSSFLKKTAKKTESLVVKADYAHYFSDILANAAVIVGLLGVWLFDIPWIDSVVGFGIALVIAKTAFELLRESFDILTDREIPREQRDEVVTILNAEKGKGITDWHLLRTRRVGSKIHIDAHIVFHDTTLLRDAHHVSDRITDKILQKIPRAVVLFHFDPHNDVEDNIEMIER